MTFGTLPPFAELHTGLNAHSLLDLYEDLDADTAGYLARVMLDGIRQFRSEHGALEEVSLVRAYLTYLTRTCELTIQQCPEAELSANHTRTVIDIQTNLLWCMRLRVWFLRADHLLGNGVMRDLTRPGR
ncbi:unnamed protein product [Symbiodinium sp. CCMP2592]|nr:unnamed protein product [Symbiodinium sp. CCMP2592]